MQRYFDYLTPYKYRNNNQNEFGQLSHSKTNYIDNSAIINLENMTKKLVLKKRTDINQHLGTVLLKFITVVVFGS